MLGIAGPILTFAGVAVGLWLGERRWKREQARQDTARFESGLREAYLELWEVVESTHLKMRASLDGLSPEVFSGMLADVNGFMFRRGIFIEPADRELVLEYLFWINEYMRIAATSARERYLLETSARLDEIPTSVAVLGELAGRTKILRERLRARIRQVAGAPITVGEHPTQPSVQLLAQLKSLVDELETRPRPSARLVIPPRSTARRTGGDFPPPQPKP